MTDNLLSAEFIATYRSFEKEGNKLLAIIRKLTAEKVCFQSMKTQRIWRLTEFGIPRNPTAFAEMNVCLEDVELVKEVRWYHIKKWNEAHRHFPLFILIKLLEDGTLIFIEDPEQPKPLV